MCLGFLICTAGYETRWNKLANHIRAFVQEEFVFVNLSKASVSNFIIYDSRIFFGHILPRFFQFREFSEKTFQRNNENKMLTVGVH